MSSEPHKILSVEELKEVIRPVAEKYGVERIYLFGSIAKGTQTEESDYDFCIEKGKIQGIFTFSAFYNAMEKAAGAEVDIITAKITDTEFLNGIKEDWAAVYGE